MAYCCDCWVSWISTHDPQDAGTALTALETNLLTVAKLTRVPLREVWRHEATDFSRWLEENIEVLTEVLDLSLTFSEREGAAGDFSIDLVAEADSGRPVVIENQLGPSDHDHLGKLVTYAAALEAEAAIWLVARPRQEHVKALGWLNEASATAFYLVQVEAVRIGESDPAPLLTKIVGPSPEASEVGEVKKDLSERAQLRRGFWTLLLDRARARTSLHTAISPQSSNWISTGAGLSGLGWSYVILQHKMRIELYIDRGDGDVNRALFDRLHSHHEEIEASFGGVIDWQRLEGRRGCRIAHHLSLGGWRSQDKWPEIADAAIDAMIRFERALRPHVKKLSAAVNLSPQKLAVEPPA